MIARRLSREEFEAALQRGHGRAFLHVRAYGLQNVADLLLDACLHDKAYDPQCEDSRAKWLLERRLIRVSPSLFTIRSSTTEQREEAGN